MTVAELIEYLSKLDQTLPVVINTSGDGYWLMNDADLWLQTLAFNNLDGNKLISFTERLVLLID